MEQIGKVEMTPPIVFIPVFNDLIYLKDCIDNLYLTTTVPFHLLIIESESTDGAKEYCDLLPKLYPDKYIEIIHTKKEGPMKAYNHAFGIAKERKRDIYMTQTDVIHYKQYKCDWLFEMIKIRMLKQDTGCVVAQNAWGVCRGRYIEGFMWGGFWSIYIPYETIEKIGGFDENYETGDAVDIDWSYALYKAGLMMYVVNIQVNHHHLTAHDNDQRADLEEIKVRNGEYFKRKWNL